MARARRSEGASPAATPRPKQNPKSGVQVRLSPKMAKLLKQASSFDDATIADFVDAILYPVAQKWYDDAVLKRADQIRGKKA